MYFVSYFVFCAVLISESEYVAVADPGFPDGGGNPVGWCQGPTQRCRKRLVCKNERIWTLRGARAGDAPWIR